MTAAVDDPDRRFEYESDEPLALQSVFPDDDGDALYEVWRVMPDDSGHYDGLVDADELVAG